MPQARFRRDRQERWVATPPELAKVQRRRRPLLCQRFVRAASPKVVTESLRQVGTSRFTRNQMAQSAFPCRPGSAETTKAPVPANRCFDGDDTDRSRTRPEALETKGRDHARDLDRSRGRANRAFEGPHKRRRGTCLPGPGSRRGGRRPAARRPVHSGPRGMG